MLEYAVHRARTAGEMPADVLQTVAGALTARGDQDAVATAIGVRLPALHRHAPDHRTALYGLAPGRPSPADSWLRWGPYDRQVLAALDRAELLAALRDASPGPAPGAAAHTAAVLLADPAFLGDPAVLWAELATGSGGADAAGLLLAAIATRTPRTDGPVLPDAAERLAAAADLWRAALAAGLPSGALAGAGAFADTGLDEDLWLSLTRASAEHTPALTDADLVAERAARHPDSEDALLLTAQLFTHPAETGQDTAVRRHALLDAAAARPADEHPAALRALREMLSTPATSTPPRPEPSYDGAEQPLTRAQRWRGRCCGAVRAGCPPDRAVVTAARVMVCRDVVPRHLSDADGWCPPLLT
ncbi:hypothetical protein [Streptomyces sp. NPDC056730]|uniref:hypothetical protein n=1 Tax=unclassified Streptomyces TaxID=2593676 RepID=UPI0036B34F19